MFKLAYKLNFKTAWTFFVGITVIISQLNQHPIVIPKINCRLELMFSELKFSKVTFIAGAQDDITSDKVIKFVAFKSSSQVSFSLPNHWDH